MYISKCWLNTYLESLSDYIPIFYNGMSNPHTINTASLLGDIYTILHIIHQDPSLVYLAFQHLHYCGKQKLIAYLVRKQLITVDPTDLVTNHLIRFVSCVHPIQGFPIYDPDYYEELVRRFVMDPHPQKWIGFLHPLQALQCYQPVVGRNLRLDSKHVDLIYGLAGKARFTDQNMNKLLQRPYLRHIDLIAEDDTSPEHPDYKGVFCVTPYILQISRNSKDISHPIIEFLRENGYLNKS